MNIYKPVPSKGVAWGIGMMIACGIVVLIPLILSLHSGQVLWPVALIMGITFLGLVGMFAYFTLAAKNMAYAITDQEIVIKSGFSTKRVPFSSVEHVSVIMGGSVLKVVGASWPGFHLGSFTSPTGKGSVNLYATRVMGEIVIIKTKWESIGITPADSDAFLTDLNNHIPGLDQKESSTLIEETPFQAWKDKKFLVLTGIALAILAGTGIYLSQVIPNLPSQVPLHFNIKGQVDRYGSPTEVYMPFGIGVAVVLMMLGINTISSRNNRASAYMIGIVAVFISILFSLIAVAMTLTAA